MTRRCGGPNFCGACNMKAKLMPTLLVLAITLAFLWCCGADTDEASIADTRAGTIGNAKKAHASPWSHRTKTGKTILVSESHPLGQSLGTIEVSTEGFEHEFAETFENRDPVSAILLDDLDGNGFDEIYIVTTSAGSGSYGGVLGFASNRDMSLSMIHFPDVENGDPNFKGYMGHDLFAIADGKLVRTFPIYNDGDANRHPSGGSRKLIYGLYPGEAMWQLRIETAVSETPP